MSGTILEGPPSCLSYMRELVAAKFAGARAWGRGWHRATREIPIAEGQSDNPFDGIGRLY